MASKGTKISSLKKDKRNANKGTDLGKELVSNSFKKHGAGRSVLADKNMNLIAGNHAFDGALQAGIQEIIIVPTDGTKLVVVQRTDIDINTKAGREMAIADNRTSQANISLDETILQELSNEFDIELEELGIELTSLGGGPNFNEEDYDGDDASEQMETDFNDGKAPPENIFPLSIVLNKAQRLRWEQFKKEQKCKSDQQLFELIYEHAKNCL